ncbi:MAG: DUF4262 domain-containing protein [Pseudomonadota bacterium]
MTELTDFEQRIVANVEKHGCHVMSVFDPDGELPEFTYSIGFPETVGQPEVIIFGLSSDIRHSMVNETLRLCRDGLVLEDGEQVSGLLEGHYCIAREVPSCAIDAEHFGSAIWFNRHIGHGGLARAFQIVWPGALNGLFPWDKGAGQEVIDAQPALYEAAA